MREKQWEQEIKEILKKNQGPEIQEKRRRGTIEFVTEQMKKQTLMTKKSYFTRILEEAAFISPMTWAMQAILFVFFASRKIVNLDVLSILAPLVGIIGITEILKSYSHNVWEVETVCRYDLRQLMGMKMLIIGITDFLILISMIAIVGETGETLVRSLFFILVPFHLSNGIYLAIMKVMNRKCSNTILIMAGILCAFLVSIGKTYFTVSIEIKEVLSNSIFLVFSIIVSFLFMIGMGYWFLKNIKENTICFRIDL